MSSNPNNWKWYGGEAGRAADAFIKQEYEDLENQEGETSYKILHIEIHKAFRLGYLVGQGKLKLKDFNSGDEDV